jgi:hypothetical protein
MKNLFSSKVIAAVLIAGALGAVGSAPASAQSLSHDGSLLPHYFDKNGELKWGDPAAAQQVAPSTSRNLYLYAKPQAHRVHTN